MEDNTINLGNVVNTQHDVETLTGVVNSTVVGTVVESEPATVVSTEQIQVNNVDNTVISNNTITSSTQVIDDSIQPQTVDNDVVVTNSEPTIQSGDGFQLKTATLVEMVNNAIKAAICNDMIVLSTVFQLKFDNSGFEIVSTDGKNTLIQKCTDITYTQEASLCVSADLFTKLVNKLDTEYVVLKIDEEKRTLIVKSNGEFILSEVYDITTGQAIILDTTASNVLESDTSIDLDISAFVNSVEKANNLSGNNNIFAEYTGVYCMDKIYSTDKSCMFGAPNVPELQNEQFYLSQSFVKLLVSVKLNGNVKFVLRKNAEGEVVGIIIKSQNICMMGPTDDMQSQYPIQALQGLLSETFNNKFTVSKNRLISVLEKAALFIVENDQEKQSCKFVFNENSQTINVQSQTKSANQIIPIAGLTTRIQDISINVPEALKVLKNFSDDEITCTVDTNSDRFVKMSTGNIEQLISIVHFQ